MAITKQEETLVTNAAKGQVICTAVVRLYQSSQREYQYQSTGYFALIHDQIFRFVLVDVRGSVAYEFSFTDDCKYQRDLAHFYSFVGRVFGL